MIYDTYIHKPKYISEVRRVLFYVDIRTTKNTLPNIFQKIRTF